MESISMLPQSSYSLTGNVRDVRNMPNPIVNTPDNVVTRNSRQNPMSHSQRISFGDISERNERPNLHNTDSITVQASMSSTGKGERRSPRVHSRSRASTQGYSPKFLHDIAWKDLDREPQSTRLQNEYLKDSSQPPIRARSRRRSSSIRNLSEMAAPAPVQENDLTDTTILAQPHMSRRLNLVDDLTEMTAPAPVRSEVYNEWQGARYLEDEAPNSYSHEEQEEEAEDEAEDDEPRQSKLLVQLYIHSYLIFFSFFGTLARVGLQALTFYPGAPVVITNLWANFSGCLVMGFLTEDYRIFHDRDADPTWRRKEKKHPESDASSDPNDPRIAETPKQNELTRTHTVTSSMRASHKKFKKSIPLYVGLTTGFCGCFTSFSTFSRDMFFAIGNDIATPLNHPSDTSPVSSTRPRSRGDSVLAVLAVVILTLTVNIAALKLGGHTALFVDRYIPSLPRPFVRNILNPVVVILALAAWIGSVIACIFPPGGANFRGEILFALPFSPLGCLMRYYLSMRLNGIVDWFPLGTFTANIFGVSVLAMCYDLQHARLLSSGLPGAGIIGCQILQGIEDGFCGCLTTVSTWVLELCTLRQQHAYFYGAASVCAAMAVVVVVMGGVQWSVGFVSPVCSLANS